jgi:hypothetical protein
VQFDHDRLWVLLFVEYGVDKWTLNETTWEIREYPTLPESIAEDKKRYERWLAVAETNSASYVGDYMNQVIARRFRHFTKHASADEILAQLWARREAVQS